MKLETSFAERKLTLGYRRLVGLAGVQARNAGVKARFNAHEFHYATTLRADGEPLWQAEDAAGKALPPMGLQLAAGWNDDERLLAWARRLEAMLRS